MENIKLGQIIEGKHHRDAIHIAVAPVEAAEDLEPGQRIGLLADGRASGKPFVAVLGIVDPFLQSTVLRGPQFWLWPTPYTITNLRHDWTHPAFEDGKPGERKQ